MKVNENQNLASKSHESPRPAQEYWMPIASVPAVPNTQDASEEQEQRLCD